MTPCRRTLIALLLLGSFACHGTVADAEFEATLGFADALLSEGEHYRAITEYKRVIFLLGPGRNAARARAFIGIGAAFFQGEDFFRASDWLRTHRREYETRGSWGAGERLLLRALLRVGELDEAALMASEHNVPEGVFYSGLVHAYGRRWDAARASFTSIAPDQPCAPAALWNAEIMTAADRAGHKSPRLAGSLAAVPGLGYLYAGHPQSAMAALFMNALLITGGIQAYQGEQYALGGLVSFLALTWYAGNIYGSVCAAGRYNDRRAEAFLIQLQE